jgi:protein phosphatase
VLIVSNQAFVAHVGDTRAYLMRRGELVQLTRDDSLVPDLVRSATAHPGPTRLRQAPALLTCALGVEPSSAIAPKIAHYTLHPHDALMLCTDGVTRALGTGDLTGALSARDAVKSASDRLVGLARGAGSVDNATVVVARNATVHGPSADATALSVAAPWRWAVALLAALSLFIVSGAVVRSYWFGDDHLFLAQDAAGDVGLFAGAQGSFLGLPLSIERTPYHIAVSDLSAADQSKIADGLPVAGADAAQAVVARWQAQPRR